jgi:hypothetical protein
MLVSSPEWSPYYVCQHDKVLRDALAAYDEGPQRSKHIADRGASAQIDAP